MKTIFIILSAMLFFSNTFAQCSHAAGAAHQHDEQKATANADSLSKASFRVYGNCGMCEGRIRKALKIDGVTNSKWDSETQMVEVRYEASKTSPEKFHKAISEAGHDTEKMKAPDKVYNKLPGCCQYERNKELEKK